MLLQQQQKGMTFLGYVIVLSVIGFFAVMIMKLVPLYLEYQSVVSIMENVASEYGASAAPGEIRSTIGKRLGVNNVDSVGPKDFKFEQAKGTTVLRIQYEARTQFAGNLWFLLVFDHGVELRGT